MTEKATYTYIEAYFVFANTTFKISDNRIHILKISLFKNCWLHGNVISQSTYSVSVNKSS